MEKDRSEFMDWEVDRIRTFPKAEIRSLLLAGNWDFEGGDHPTHRHFVRIVAWYRPKMPNSEQMAPPSPSTTEVGDEELKLVACEKCDALFNYPKIDIGEAAYCYHCGFAIFARRKNAVQRSAAWAISAAALFAVANFFPFISLNVGGQVSEIVLAGSVGALAKEEYLGLATAVATFILAAPAIFIAGSLMVLIPLLAGRRLPGARSVARLIYGFSMWDMTEVFLLGVLVSLLKLFSLATVTIGISFYAFAVMVVCMTASLTCIGRHELWELLERARK